MLPTCRKGCMPFPIPEFNLNASNIDGFMDELRAYHEQFQYCFLMPFSGFIVPL